MNESMSDKITLLEESGYKRIIHLLYVPTIYCNLGCTYCYLGRQTDRDMLQKDWQRSLSTLTTAVDKFLEQGVLPFNISLHGGEVTTLPGHALEDLLLYINRYYAEHADILKAQGFAKDCPHIKTNLYNFHRHYDLLCRHRVSISASIDLPLSVHNKHRVTKSGGSTLARTLENVRLLRDYPHRKKMSATLFYENIARTEELIGDIWLLHREYGFDMNEFNFMFGFESELNTEKIASSNGELTRAVSERQQVEFYHALKAEFMGTELEPGFRKNWFDEFTPSYCTNALNCGEKFYLLQSDGNVYSCVRGQGVEPFHYGNILQDSVERILQNGSHGISRIHKRHGLHDDCRACEYLHYCKTGCAFVKNEQGNGKSYTCALQKAIYRDSPSLYPPATGAGRDKNAREYIAHMHPNLLPSVAPGAPASLVLPNDLYDPKNTLQQLIDGDPVLAVLYAPDRIWVEIDGRLSPLQSQILKRERTIVNLNDTSEVKLHIEAGVFEANCNETVRNNLYLQMLRDTKVVYGDEQREKQQHTFNHQVFFPLLATSRAFDKGYLCCDLTGLLRLHRETFQPGVLNNLFVTTQFLREYHYLKQKNNGFYHIQALNLPFQNLEFYWNNE